ncbi:Conserved hypothetical protein [Shewanella piezotolerans WP3]|uniref:Secreted protein n=1 Tax=Shewanella piezotolerans (strain WP3 / JCM 13877) TaxID=225849 RepID=B8CV70_SHEPW|nr:hypothetical protein [Shewanella piezotolerans]ACJ31546.1 Conserved hypothetical protein [Shewanella piezotolerans WP3]
MLLTFYRVTIIFLLLHCPYAIASDPSTLPLGTVLDDKGQPLTIPTQNKTALSYSTPPAVNSSHNIKTPLSKPKSKYKKTSRKQQLASRKNVANDAGCRWLNGRMKQLEKQLRLGVNHRNQHQQQELNVRQDEWECLKCGVEGPNPSDHHSCQYRR